MSHSIFEVFFLIFQRQGLLCGKLFLQNHIVLYDPSYKKVEALRKSAYEYHVQGTNQMILKGVMLMLDMENE